MSKHTPGPWSRDKYGSMIDANGESIVLRGTTTLCSGSSDRLEMAEANTDLACAAPLLLAVLEKSIVDLANLFFELKTGRQPTDAERSKIIELAKPGTLLGDMIAATKKARGEE